MKVRRRRPLSEPVARAALALCRIEAATALLDRVRPLRFADEVARLAAGFARGERLPPRLEYAPRASLTEARRELDDLARTHEVGDVEEQLLAGRARELSLDAALAESVGLPAFRGLAARRFPLPDAADRAEALAHELLQAAASPDDAEEDLHLSDDPSDGQSLWSEISRRLSRERWPVRIEVVPGLVSLAAVADGVVRVRAGARLTSRVARRVALHEVEGHVRPRVLGRALGGVFVAGTARCAEDEEGRAIWLEARAGLLDPERMRTLARRYLAAASVRHGAELWDTVELLAATDATAAVSIELACRVHRGGGLARELIYLTGYVRAARELTARPELDAIQQSGRVSLQACALLRDSLELDDHGDVV